MRISRTIPSPHHSSGSRRSSRDCGDRSIPKDAVELSGQGDKAVLGLASISMVPGLGALASGRGAVACLQDGLKGHAAVFGFSVLTNLAGTASLIAGAVTRDPLGIAVGVGLLGGTAVQNGGLVCNLQSRGLI